MISVSVIGRPASSLKRSDRRRKRSVCTAPRRKLFGRRGDVRDGRTLLVSSLASWRRASFEDGASDSSFLAMPQHLLGEGLEILRPMPLLVKGQDRLSTDLRLVDRLTLADHRCEH